MVFKRKHECLNVVWIQGNLSFLLATRQTKLSSISCYICFSTSHHAILCDVTYRHNKSTEGVKLVYLNETEEASAVNMHLRSVDQQPR